MGVVEEQFSNQSKIEQSKMIVDKFIDIIENGDIYEFPENLYNEFKKHLNFIEESINQNNIIPKQKVYFIECLNNGKRAFSKISIMNIYRFK